MNRAPASSGPKVIVVGAGPAGATAARSLALAGIPVRLLDRAAFPRNKPCGGALSIRVLRRFPYLDAALDRIATHRITRLHLEGPGGSAADVQSDGPAALMIRRVEFDALLVDLAREAGAEIVSNADIVRASEDDRRVTLEARDGRRFDADLVVAADGVHSLVARRLGINPGWPASRLALDMMEETPSDRLRAVEPGTLWVAYGYRPGVAGIQDPGSRKPGSRKPGSRKPGSGEQGLEIGDRGSEVAEGYAYVFPKRDHVNVGIGYVLDHYRRDVDEAPYSLQRRFVDDLRQRGVMAGESVRGNFTPFLIPVGGPLASPGRGRVLLAGDAGGFVNGFTAEGIYYAMVSGDLAARTVARTPPDAISSLASRYKAACDREVGAELRDSVVIQRYLFTGRGRVDRVVGAIPRAGTLTRLFLDYAMGTVPYKMLRRRLVASAPRLAVRLATRQIMDWVIG